MTREEYRKSQAMLARYERRCMEEAQRENKALLAGMAKEALKTGKTDQEAHETLVAGLYAVYKKYRSMAADKALDIAERYLEDCVEQAGLKPLVKNAERRQPDYMYRHTADAGGWYKTPDGATVYVTAARRLEFLRRYHLSGSESPLNVWKIFEEDAREAEERVFAVIEGGAVLGRDRVDIARDLEALIRYKDGGSRVIGRWGAMVSPYKTVTVDGKETIIRDVKAVAQGWEREYINHLNESKGISPGDEGWIGYGSKEERELFRDPKELADKQAWIDQHSTGKRGRTLLPPGAREYVNRIGKSGLDYRAIRVTRTESSVRFNERQRDIARNSPAATGLVERKLAPQRDGWKCACVDAYKRINENGGMRPDEIPEEYQAPLHPNCLCHDMPVMRPMKEVREEIMKQYFGEDYAKQTV